MTEFIFGNYTARYREAPLPLGKKTVGLTISPTARKESGDFECDGLVQVAFSGDQSLVAYGEGVTMRNRSSCAMQIERQRREGNAVITLLTDGEGNYYTHTLCFDEATETFSVQTEYENRTGGARTLEMLSSFSLGGIGAAHAKPATAGLTLHRMTSAWSRECRLKSERFSALGLEPSWSKGYGVKCERFGEIGSMSNRGYYPFAAVECEAEHICWGVQLEAPYSWQLEVYLEGEACSLSGGAADYEFGHWKKMIPDGGKFCSHKAFLAIRRDLLSVCNALVRRFDARLSVPESEESIPVLFNEYCTTWGCPSEENLKKIVAALRGLGVGTFVIDCGWFKPKNGDWALAVGDWKESADYFPHGIASAVRDIENAGMRAGIWFEFECACRESELFRREEMLLTRGGNPLTCRNHRFLDLRKECAREYLEERFLSFLKKNGFSYLKIDYNDAYGVGCDGAESLGEGGRQVAEESIAWLDRLKRELPNLVVENCSSGGSRIEPLRMGKVSMCSFSDAHEGDEIPFIAANVSRVVPARQNQIWATLRAGMSPNRIYYKICAGFLGRMCLSGDIHLLNSEQRELVRAGIAFYAEVRDIIRYGEIRQIDCTAEYYGAEEGSQIYGKEYAGRRLITAHFKKGGVEVKIPLAGLRVIKAYGCLDYREENDVLCIRPAEHSAGVFLVGLNG